jgi:Ca2+:H+ antiporter
MSFATTTNLHLPLQVVELILSIAALNAGLYDVVSTSLMGSILSNLLLVLGMSFFVGGLK